MALSMQALMVDLWERRYCHREQYSDGVDTHVEERSGKLPSPAPSQSKSALRLDQDAENTDQESEALARKGAEWNVWKTACKVKQSFDLEQDCPFCASEFSRMDLGIADLFRGGQECRLCGESRNKTSRQAAQIWKDRENETKIFSNYVRLQSQIGALKAEAHQAATKKMEEEKNQRPGYQYMRKLQQAKQKQREEAEKRGEKFYADQVEKGNIIPATVEKYQPPVAVGKERDRLNNWHPAFGRRSKSAEPETTRTHLHSEFSRTRTDEGGSVATHRLSGVRPSLEIDTLSQQSQLCPPGITISNRRLPLAVCAASFDMDRPYALGEVSGTPAHGATVPIRRCRLRSS